MANTVYGPAQIDEEIARIQPDASAASGRRAEILLKADDLRVLLVTLRKNATLAEHSAPGTVTIHAVAGEMSVATDDETYTLQTGGIVSLAANVRHSVTAIADGAILVTIAWPARSTA